MNDNSPEIRPEITIGLYSIAGHKARNDDSYGVLIPSPPLLDTKGIAMAIADGMSTSEAGKEASETCVKTFLTDYYSTHESWSVKTSVSRVLTALNRWLYSQSQVQYMSDRAMVSTFSGLVLKGAMAHIFHAGDSRIYLLRSGTMRQMTRDHRAHLSRDREVLSRAFGIDPALEVDYRTEPMMAGDILLFTTDGVHDFLDDQQINRLVLSHLHNLDEAAKLLVESALAAKSNDNISCQIVRIDNPGRPSRRAHLQKLTRRPFPPELEPGMVMDGYRIERDLYMSSRSQVYLAVEEESGERVVLKTPSHNFEDDPAYIELFTREEWIGSQIDNPHVLKVRKSKRPRRFLYTVLDYVEGQTLSQWMHDHPRPSLLEVREIVGQIAIGLRAFHRKEMIHQDLKPDNIIIDRHGTVKIIDFGSTRVAGLQEVEGADQLPSLLGTRDYSAPELLLGQKPTNCSDIYSLGVITYEMLTGKLPYGRGFAAEKDVGRLPLTPAHEHDREIPRFVSYALAKAVDANPRKRYGLLSEFLVDLEKPNAASREAVMYQPLIKRNPVMFWRGAALILLALNIIQLFWRLHQP